MPVRSEVKALEAAAANVGISFIPWQRTVGRYLYALGQGERWLFQEVAAIVSRQNGKSEIVKPHIIERLARGRHILHAAQTRELPRRLFFTFIVPYVQAHYPDATIKRATGQEYIELSNGGMYIITAATGPGPRGLTIDDLIIDELREIDEEFVAAAIPTMSASRNPQVLYLSNAGSEASISLNAVKLRAEDDPALAYLEWSAAPDRAVDDPIGWIEANPSIGHEAFPMLMANLERMYRSHRLAGTLAHFETENLCRWVTTMREHLVDDLAWTKCRDEVGKPVRPAIGVAMDPDGRRASIAMAWMEGSRVALTMVADVHGEPIDTAAFGETLKALAQKHVAKVGYDAHTDWQLAKYLRKGFGENLTGQKHAGASAEFARLVNEHRLAWSDADAITDDLTWTVRKVDGPDGSYQAVHAKDDRPITASLAAIRAVGLASQPASAGRLVVR